MQLQNSDDIGTTEIYSESLHCWSTAMDSLLGQKGWANKERAAATTHEALPKD